MEIEIKIDETCHKLKVIIETNKMNEEISRILHKLTEEPAKAIVGVANDKVMLLNQGELIRIYTTQGNVFAMTQQQEYQLRLRLYELENCLDKSVFVRISNSEIINLRQVKEFDLKLTGTICVSLSNGETTYVSRRYVNKIKQVLGR